MRTEVSEEKKKLVDVIDKINKIEIKDEAMADMSLKIGKVYKDVIKKYFNCIPVIQLNYLEDLKKRTKTVKTPDEFKDILENDLYVMQNRQNPSKYEQIEFLIAKKVHRDVVQGKGKNNDFSDIHADYDGQDIKFGGFFSEEDLENLANK